MVGKGHCRALKYKQNVLNFSLCKVFLLVFCSSDLFFDLWEYHLGKDSAIKFHNFKLQEFLGSIVYGGCAIFTFSS